MDNALPKKLGGNLLVVDDDLFTRQSLEALLTSEGYEVRCAPDGQTALMFAGEDPPELILLDIRLPDMDGFEVCRHLREDSRTGRILVIFITGLNEVVDKLKGFAAGGVDFITKPYQDEEVLARVGSHLDLKRTREALQRTNEELEERVEERTAELEERLRFETLMFNLSAGFVSVLPAEVDREINRGLQSITEFFGADRCSIGLFSEEGTQLVRAFEYHSEDGEPAPESMSSEQFPWYMEQLRRGNPVVIDRVEDLPPEAENERRICQAKNMKSLLSIPLMSGGRAMGSCALVSARAERTWPEDLVQRFRLLADVFAGVLVRKLMEEQLYARLREIEALKKRLEDENIHLREEIKLQYVHEEIVGRSEKMKKVLSRVEQVARTDSTVLIQGETGTGKELLARAIHRLSSHNDRPLVTVNCASLPPTLIESELFGREKGAYTGALTRMIGRFEVADGSTLFLDEIGELPLDLQSKLLRVLEEGKFERLGSIKTLQVNVRIIAATNRDLAQDVNQGRFRKDLYYRLNVFPIAVPPLRERREDIPLLVWAFVRQLEEKMGRRIDAIPRKSMEALANLSWPGNVRELRNVVEHAMIMSSGRTLTVSPPKVEHPGAPETRNLQDLERRHILDVLEKTAWRLMGTGGAAEILGMKRTTLQARMKKLGIKRPAT